MTITIITPEPTVISAYVKASETVAAGDFVKADASSSNVVDSTGMSMYATADIQVSACDAATDYQVVIGLAAADSTGSTYIPVYTEGIFILKATAAITAGYKIQVSETASQPQQVENVGNVGDTGAYNAEHCVGIALTGTSAADKYIVALIRI